MQHLHSYTHAHVPDDPSGPLPAGKMRPVRMSSCFLPSLPSWQRTPMTGRRSWAAQAMSAQTRKQVCTTTRLAPCRSAVVRPSLTQLSCIFQLPLHQRTKAERAGADQRWPAGTQTSKSCLRATACAGGKDWIRGLAQRATDPDFKCRMKKGTFVVSLWPLSMERVMSPRKVQRLGYQAQARPELDESCQTT